MFILLTLLLAATALIWVCKIRIENSKVLLRTGRNRNPLNPAHWLPDNRFRSGSTIRKCFHRPADPICWVRQYLGRPVDPISWTRIDRCSRPDSWERQTPRQSRILEPVSRFSILKSLDLFYPFLQLCLHSNRILQITPLQWQLLWH